MVIGRGLDTTSAQDGSSCIPDVLAGGSGGTSSIFLIQSKIRMDEQDGPV